MLQKPILKTGSTPVLVSVSRACNKQGIFPRTAVEELIKDPAWSMFKPPDGEKKASVMAVAA